MLASKAGTPELEVAVSLVPTIRMEVALVGVQALYVLQRDDVSRGYFLFVGGAAPDPRSPLFIDCSARLPDLRRIP